jgi:hypothetical protein
LIVAAAARISTRTKLPTAEALFQYLNELEFDFAGSAEALLELLNAAATSVDRRENTAALCSVAGSRWIRDRVR